MLTEVETLTQNRHPVSRTNVALASGKSQSLKKRYLSKAAKIDPVVALWKERDAILAQCDAINEKANPLYDELPQDLQICQVQCGEFIKEDGSRSPLYAFSIEEIERQEKEYLNDPHHLLPEGKYRSYGEYFDRCRDELLKKHAAQKKLLDVSGWMALHEQEQALWKRIDILTTQITDTVATTPEGFAIQIKLLKDYVADGVENLCARMQECVEQLAQAA